MDSFRIDIADETVVEALRKAAQGHGRSIEEEINRIVLEHPAIAARRRRPPADDDRNWVQELLDMGRGLDLKIPGSLVPPPKARRADPDYPSGMEPLPGEGVGTWMHRITRPGLDTDGELDRWALRDPYADPA